MIKECVILNGKIINIGPWDYQYEEVDGKLVVKNPLPEGAVIEQRDFEYTSEHGWREVGFAPEPTEIDYLLDLDFRLSMIELGL